jgi:hypothetical protein
MARQRKRSRARHAAVSLSFEQQLALFAVAAVAVVAGLVVGASPLGSPAGQQFAPAVSARDGCADSDGLNYFSQGTVGNVLGGVQRSFSDYCASAITLAEYYCSGFSAEVSFVDCPNGCFNGACS